MEDKTGTKGVGSIWAVLYKYSIGFWGFYMSGNPLERVSDLFENILREI